MVETTARGRIFISYRREESAYPAGWLFDRLSDHFGSGQVFKDIDSIAPGDDFVEVITEAVASCDVLLALIGNEWLTVADDDGTRRIDNPGDFVRVEIEAALNRNVRVVPVLIGGARMPRAEDLPTSLVGLSRRQALELSPNRFEFETTRLFRVLDETVAGRPSDGGDDTQAVAEGKPDPKPAPVEPEPAPPPADPVPLGVTICAVVGALLLGVGVFARWDDHKGGRSFFDLKFGDAGAHHAAVFTALSPIVLVLGAFMALALALRPRTRDVGAGMLIGFGIAGTAKYVGILRGTLGNGDEHRGDAPFVFTAVIAGALLLVAAGVLLARRGAASTTAAPLGIAPVLVFAAVVLIVTGSVIPFNGGGTDAVARKVVPDEGWRALDVLGVAAAALVTFVLLTSGRRLLAAGLLIAFGLESAALWVRYLGVPLIEYDSVASFGAGAAAGLIGGVLILAAGLLVWRREESGSARASPTPASL